jgi:phenylacetate-CoA ligase
MALSGGGMNTEQRLRAILDNKCTVVVCTPTYALHLAEVSRRIGMDLRRSSVRRTIHAGEPGASLPSVRHAIESAWGAVCFDHAGATEVGAWAYPCESQSMHLNEAEFLFEVIDPKTGAELEGGIPGELVITNFGRAGMPAVRYRTGDIVRISASPCECGRSFVSIEGGVLGRADDMMIIRGVNIYPAGIDDLIRAIPEVAEYEVAVRRTAGIDDLVITIEAVAGSRFDKIARELHDGFRMRFNLRVELKEAAEGSLPRYEFKARRFKGIVGEAP